MWSDQPSPPALFILLFENDTHVRWGLQTHTQKLERRNDDKDFGLLETPDNCMKDIRQEETDLAAGGL